MGAEPVGHAELDDVLVDRRVGVFVAVLAEIADIDRRLEAVAGVQRYPVGKAEP